MAIPHLPEVRIALWEELEKAGGTAKRLEVIERLAQRFQLTQSDREQLDPTGAKTFDHRVDSAVAQSRRVGWMEPVENTGAGIWKLSVIYFEDNPKQGQVNTAAELQKRLDAVDKAFNDLKQFISTIVTGK